ncbi:MAG: hypothetical protein JSS27_03930 [Planctomycetes bacterium]|nr:hypothetical protein [Planctomycetota bacterium]
MATVIKAAERSGTHAGEAFNLDDVRVQADVYLGRVREQAVQMLVEAQKQAEAIKQAAAAEARRHALQQLDSELNQKIAAQMQTVLPALEAAVKQIGDARPGWLAHWERRAVHLAAAIAGRVLRRRLPDMPEVTLDLVREALELAAGASQVRVVLNPDDYEVLRSQVERLTAEIAKLGTAEIVSDANVARGGCRVDTLHGSLDQGIDAQLARIEEELT